MNTVRQILQLKGYDVWSISPEASVLEALRLMADKDIGALLVLKGDKLVGVITERDYARKIILQGKASRDTAVSEIMSRNLHIIHPDQTAEECMELMTLKRVRHLPVLDGETVLGVISIGDVVRDIIYRQRETIKSLSEKKSANE